MKLTKVDLVKNLQQDVDLCRLELDDGADSAYIVWNYTNMLTYLGGEVVCTFRQDMVDGTIQKFINTLARVGVVHTLERSDNIKLYVDKVDNHCTVSFHDIAEGQTARRVTVYVVDVSMDSSAKATWWDLTIQDRDRRIAKMKLFNPEGSDSDYKGRYIMCDLRCNKYGFSTDAIVTVDTTFAYSPEVDIAATFIGKTFADDTDIMNALQRTNFIEIAKHHVSEEPGYILVRLAMELDIANEMTNLTGDVSPALVKRALLLDKFWVLSSASPFSKEIVGYAMSQNARIPNVRPALLVLFSDDQEYEPARKLVRAIQHLADELVKVKKGVLK